VKDTTVIVKVADNVKLEMEKTSVTNVVKGSDAS
jgi:preprotein translocase subunit YajC